MVLQVGCGGGLQGGAVQPSQDVPDARGVERNDWEAARWFQTAAQQGHAGAQYQMGVICESGEGVPEDCGKAAEWYLKSAEQGNVPAGYRLGCLYMSGKGVRQDYKEAFRRFEKGRGAGRPHVDEEPRVSL